MARHRRFTLLLVPHNKDGARQLGGPFVLCCSLVLAFIFVLGVWSIGSTYVISIFARSDDPSARLEIGLWTRPIDWAQTPKY